MLQAQTRGPIGLDSTGAFSESGTLARSVPPPPGPSGLYISAPFPMQIRSAKKQSKKNPHGITVHRQSEVSGSDWIKKIKASQHVPTHYQAQIRWKSSAIQVKDPKRFKVPNNVIAKAWRDDWLSLFLHRDWEITTAHLDVSVTKGAAKPIVVAMVPHLDTGETIDGLTRHTLTEKFAKVSQARITKGQTFPSGIKLNSGRRIIIVATRATLDLDGKKSQFTFLDDELVEVWFHETAAHAARNTLGLTDTHGDRTVESYAKDIAEMIPVNRTAQAILKSIKTYLTP